MIKVAVGEVINRPVEEVFAYTANPENDPQWQSGIEEARLTSDGPLGKGSTAREVIRFLGRRMDIEFLITEYEQDKKLSVKTTGGPVSFEQTATYEPVDGGTRLNFTMEGDAKGFFKLADPLLARMVKRQVQGDLGNLKDLMEEHAEG